MQKYTTRELIPGYLGDGTQIDEEFLEFHRWLRDIKYRKFSITDMEEYGIVEDIEDIIHIFNLRYDISLTSEQLISRGFIGLILYNSIIADKENIERLFNYNIDILKRMASIYSIGLTNLVNNILYNNQNRSRKFHSYLVTNYLQSIYDPQKEVPLYINALTIKNKHLLRKIPSHVKMLKIRKELAYNSMTKDIYPIPKTVTHIKVNNLDKYELHDDIKYITCKFAYKSKLPKNLIYLECEEFHNDVKIPSSVKALIVYDMNYLDTTDIPEDIEYLNCTAIKSNDDRIFNRCKYLSIEDFDELSGIFPNLEVLHVYVDPEEIKSLNNLICIHGPIIDIPNSVLFVHNLYIDYEIPNNVRVVNTNIVTIKYPNVKTITCTSITPELVPKGIVMIEIYESLNKHTPAIYHNYIR